MDENSRIKEIDVESDSVCAIRDSKFYLSIAFLRTALYIPLETLFWIGLWNSFDYYLFHRSILRDVLYMLIGGFWLAFIRTWMPRSDWGPYGYPVAYEINHTSFHFTAKSYDYFIGLIDTVANAVCWTGVWSLIDYNPNYPMALGRELLFMIIGLFVWFFWDIFLRDESLNYYFWKNNKDEISESNKIVCASRDSKFWFTFTFLRNGIYVGLETVFWIGIWNSFDYYLFERSILRDVLYMIIGGLLVAFFRCWLPRYDWTYYDSEAIFKIDHTSFHFSSKVFDYFVGMVDTVAYAMCWAGVWSLIDYNPNTPMRLGREMLYTIVGLFVWYFWDIFLRNESLDFYYYQRNKHKNKHHHKYDY